MMCDQGTRKGIIIYTANLEGFLPEIDISISYKREMGGWTTTKKKSSKALKQRENIRA